MTRLRRCKSCWVLTAAAVLLAGSVGVARGDEGIGGVLRFLFGGNRGAQAQPAPAVEAVAEDVPADFENQFTPLLNKLLTAELHFAHKVCRLNAEQLDKLREVGRAKVAAIAKTYGQQQNQHQSSEWPDAREILTDAFQEQLDALLPADAAARYREEIAARREARQEAAREMILVLLDRRVSLTPEQYAQIGEDMSRQRSWGWARNMQVYLYDEYAPMPDDNLLRPHLSERQQQILAGRTNYGRISFGWEQDLGLMTPWGDVGDVELAAPANDEDDTRQPEDQPNEESK